MLALYAAAAQTPLRENSDKTLTSFSEGYTDKLRKSTGDSVENNKDEINAVINPLLHFVQVRNNVEMSVITIATAELLYHPDTPTKVVINEAVELTKKYGADDGYKFVNGVR